MPSCFCRSSTSARIWAWIVTSSAVVGSSAISSAGRKVEEADVETLFANPRHPYTRGLMASIPTVPLPGANTDIRLVEIPGMVPSLTKLPKGCAFAPRCGMALPRCHEEYPPLQDFGGNHLAACWRAAELAGPL